jgi:ABC-type hemin transport system substrate-binding protein
MKLFIIALLLFAAPSFSGAEQPKRVISLSPALTELIFALHFGNLLVGVSDFSDYPPEAKKIASVGAYTQPNFEKLVALKPDLIFLPLEGPEDVKHHLDQLHLHYDVISMRKLKEIGEAAEKISDVLENPQVGKDFKTKWDKSLKDLFAQKPPHSKSVFIEVQKDPLIAAGSETFLDEIANGCGATNIVKEKGYPRLSLEFTASQKIDLVLLADYFANEKEKTAVTTWWASRKSELRLDRLNQKYSPKNIVALDSDTTARPGPRLLKGIKSICEIIKGSE